MPSIRDIFKPKDQLTDKELDRGIKMYIRDGFFSMGMTTLQGGVYLTAFAIALGSSQKMVGFIASIAFLSQLMQVGGLFLLNKFHNRKRNVVILALLSRLFFIPVIFIPAFPQNQVNFLILFLLISAMTGSLPGPSWHSLLRDLIPPKRMGKINSKRIMWSTGLALVLTIAGGYFVDWWSETMPSKALYAYSLLFIIGLFSGIMGVLSILRIPEPRRQIEPLPLWKLLRSPMKDGNFRNLLIFLGTWNFALNMSSPFFVVFMLKRLEMSLLLVTVMLVVSQLSNILFLRVWGKIADRYSNKTVLILSVPLFVVVVFSWIFTAIPEPHAYTLLLLVFIHFFYGIALSGVTLGTTGIALKLSPATQAHGYMTVVGLITSVTGSLGPILGGILGDVFSSVELSVPIQLTTAAESFSLRVVSIAGLDFLFIITVLVGIMALHFLSHVKEIGEVPRKQVLDSLTDSVMTPLKSISLFSGIARVATLPFSSWMKERGRKGGKD